MGNIENYKILGKNLGFSIILTLVALFVLAMLLSLTNVSESIMTSAIIFISSFSVLTGAFLSSRKIKEKGIIFGSILGLGYILTLYLISSIINRNFCINLSALYMILGGIIGGAIGGILGVNFK